MIHQHLLLHTAICALLVLPASAQQVSFGELDRDRNNTLTRAELEARFGQRGADAVLSAQDKNRDGQINRNEAVPANRADDDSGRDDDRQEGSGRSGDRGFAGGDNDADDGDDGDEGRDDRGDDGTDRQQADSKFLLSFIHD